MEHVVQKGWGSRLWNQFRTSQLWRLLKHIAVLRSAYYLAIELRETLRESRLSSKDVIDEDFLKSNDPWNYETNPQEQERFSNQTAILDQARGGRQFQSALEIGCAEGLYTEVIAARCASLLVLDVSPTALARARARCQWSEQVRFTPFDLRSDSIPGTFDLIVLAGVLEYFSSPATFRRIRKKLTAALKPGGYLLLETTRVNPVVENALWARYLIRGKWINDFIAQDPSLEVTSSFLAEKYAITLYRKRESRSVG
jgi:2-polyprenyl-3-methyl-5-hydroxy-6-metoxy-1,4-benzoquinol methylase